MSLLACVCGKSQLREGGPSCADCGHSYESMQVLHRDYAAKTAQEAARGLWVRYRRMSQIVATVLGFSTCEEIDQELAEMLQQGESFVSVEDYPPGFIPERGEIGFIIHSGLLAGSTRYRVE